MSSKLRLVNIWTDPEPGPGGFNPMAASMLWVPDDYQPGQSVPGFVFLHGWGGYPNDAVPATLGPLLAEQGCLCLSLCLRRRGMEGQLMALADNDLRDIKLAIDYLHTNGCSSVVLIGEELGCISALHYLGKHQDRRVAGAVLLDPVPAPADWLAASAGPDYADALQLAGTAARQGAGMEVRIDLFPETGPVVTQNALNFLNWWAPNKALTLERMLETISIPLLAAGDAIPEPLAAAGNCNTQAAITDVAELAQQLTAFMAERNSVVLTDPALEQVAVDVGDVALSGLLWSPAGGGNNTTVTVLVHGLTSSPFSPLFLKMAPVLAQHSPVLAVGLRRSGWAGHESSVLDNDAEDLDAWLEFLLARGYERIVLAGASIGSITVGRFQSLRQHPNVAGVAHLMPTADCPLWFRAGVGDGPYEAAAVQARMAVAEGRGDSELIDVDVRQPPPNKYGGRFRWTQRAASWLSWFGPDADSMNSVHIANARVPLLLLSGTEDSYNDAARFAELKSAAVNAPSVEEIWYPGIDHGLAGVETQVAHDLVAWMQKTSIA